MDQRVAKDLGEFQDHRVIRLAVASLSQCAYMYNQYNVQVFLVEEDHRVIQVKQDLMAQMD